MNHDIANEKAALRRKFQAILKSIPAAERDAGSVQACERLRRQAVWQRARCIFFYGPMPVELDFTPLLEEALKDGRTVALPLYAEKTGTYTACEISDYQRDCAPGKFGLIEPKAHCLEIPLKRLDLLLAPGLGFDASGRRLGRGKGFYDRLLAGLPGAKCGVAFDQQVVEQIPAERHDVIMNFILTPTRWLEIPMPSPDCA